MRHRIKRWLWPTYYAVKRMERMMSKSFDVVIHTQEKIMALADEIKAKLNAINDATNSLALVVADIRSRLTNPSMTEAEKTEVLGLLDGVKTSLEGIAADPNNPVPPEPAVFAKSKK